MQNSAGLARQIARVHGCGTGCRGDGPALLAEVAGLLIGYHEAGLGEPRARAAARFLLETGADPELVGQWVAEGRRRNRRPRSPG